MKNIIIMGAPGSGKGTQSDKIVSLRNYIHIASGDIVRHNISAKTALGMTLLQYVSRGVLVPDDLIIEVLQDFTQDKFDENIIWDGFPRTVVQAQKLDDMLSRRNMQIDHVFYLEIDEKQLLNRIVGRLTCNNCGRTYHAVKIPPKQQWICDFCGYKLSSRSDDTRDAYKMRIQTFKKWSPSLIAYYSKKNRLVKIDANLSVNEISESILSYLDD